MAYTSHVKSWTDNAMGGWGTISLPIKALHVEGGNDEFRKVNEQSTFSFMGGGITQRLRDEKPPYAGAVVEFNIEPYKDRLQATNVRFIEPQQGLHRVPQMRWGELPPAFDQGSHATLTIGASWMAAVMGRNGFPGWSFQDVIVKFLWVEEGNLAKHREYLNSVNVAGAAAGNAAGEIGAEASISEEEAMRRVQEGERMAAGREEEKSGIDAFCRVAGRSVTKKFRFKKELHNDNTGELLCILSGELDGLTDDNTVLEFKTRKNSFLGVSPAERIQVFAYMFLAGKPKAELVEQIGEDQGKQRKHDLVWNQEEWDKNIECLKRQVQEAKEILSEEDPSRRIEILRRCHSRSIERRLSGSGGGGGTSSHSRPSMHKRPRHN